MFSKKLLTLHDVEELTGLSRSQIYALIQQQKFVRQVKIARSSRWPSDEVLAWIDARIAERDATGLSA